MDDLIDLLKTSDHCVFLSGAGVSTFSGIPDFRGESGLYTKYDADRIFSLDDFHDDPSYFYHYSKDLVYNLNEREPGLIHNVLAQMEKQGIVKAVITQNIDMLHQKAGSVNVIEIHGSPAIHHCLHCSREYSYENIADIVQLDQIPRCDDCGGLIKPDIIFYGEMLDRETLAAAIQEASEADVLVVIGSSLVVQPAASLPLYTLDNGGKLVIVNNMPTPLDRYAHLRYDDLEDVFHHIEKELL